MQVILLEKVANLGNLGDTVKVKPGYGRNYLVPGGKATPATAENLAAFEKRRAELEKAAAETLGQAQARGETLKDMAITIAVKAGDEGKLFGSVGTTDIADAISAAGVAVERHEVRLPEGAYRQIGEYEVEIHLHTDVNAIVSLNIVPE